MSDGPVLTVAVPTYNMERYLLQNLDSLVAASTTKTEVLILDNSSTDSSGAIADDYERKYPLLFTVIHKENNGYGSSINTAIERANGRYLRIVDADDWVDPNALSQLVLALEKIEADLVLMDYRTVDNKTGIEARFSCAPSTWVIGEIHNEFSENDCPVPKLHGTVFRVNFLRDTHIRLLENAYYVDEQLMIVSYISARTACRLYLDVYRYRIGNGSQSVSSRNMGLHWKERERVIRSCLDYHQKALDSGTARRTCTSQLAENIGNHFSTLFMYVKPRHVGRILANNWKNYLDGTAPDFLTLVLSKIRYLSLLNLLHVSPELYRCLKKWFLR